MWGESRGWKYWLKLGFVSYLWITFNILFLFIVSICSLIAESVYCVHIEEKVRTFNSWYWEKWHILNKGTGRNRLTGIWRKIRWNSGNCSMVTYLQFIFWGWGREDLGQMNHRFKIEVRVRELRQTWRNICLYKKTLGICGFNGQHLI